MFVSLPFPHIFTLSLLPSPSLSFSLSLSPCIASLSLLDYRPRRRHPAIDRAHHSSIPSRSTNFLSLSKSSQPPPMRWSTLLTSWIMLSSSEMLLLLDSCTVEKYNLRRDSQAAVSCFACMYFSLILVAHLWCDLSLPPSLPPFPGHSTGLSIGANSSWVTHQGRQTSKS